MNIDEAQAAVFDGFFVSFCESCDCFTVHCPECGSNACGGGHRNCGTCPATWKQQERLNKAVELSDWDDKLLAKISEMEAKLEKSKKNA